MPPLPFFDPWVWRMAWRDSRRSRGRLLVFSTALTLGVAALVAIGSVGWNLQRAIHDQARTLVGADLIVEARAPLDADTERFVGSLGGTDVARETRLASMTRFPKTDGSRLTQIRALEGDYPFYGQIETRPPEAAKDFYAGKGALLEESLLLQYGAKIGDPISIGGETFHDPRRGHETARRGQRVCQHRPARADPPQPAAGSVDGARQPRALLSPT